MYAPYIKQEEPLKTECQHFLDCIRDGKTPISSGEKGLELVRILEASSESLKRGGGPVELANFQNNGAAQRKVTNGSTVQTPALPVHPAVAARKGSAAKLVENIG
jgi:hypothetical protein